MKLSYELLIDYKDKRSSLRTIFCHSYLPASLESSFEFFVLTTNPMISPIQIKTRHTIAVTKYFVVFVTAISMSSIYVQH